ncbi:MAG: ribosome maturation factor RimM [Desulfobacteraceae bacterium]
MAGKTLFTIGEVTGVHGIGGNLKVRSFAGSKDVYSKDRFVMLENNDGNGEWYCIEKASLHKKGVLLSVKGVEDRDAAETFVGCKILVKREDLDQPGDDAYFWEDLIGLDVMDKDRGYVGRVDNIFSTGAHDVLVVKNARSGGETLVPAVFPIVVSVDVENGVLETRLPEGL